MRSIVRLARTGASLGLAGILWMSGMAPLMAQIPAIAAQAALDPKAAWVEEFTALVTGRFTSAAQAARDPRYSVVEARISRIWSERTDGVWFYQEQAILDQPGVTAEQARARPYFQRIFQVRPQSDGTLVRDTYELTDPKAVAGLPRPLTQADLGKPGCPILFERVAARTWTSRSGDCPNNWRGAVKMISRGVTTASGFANWDRGVGGEGQHVWGPTDGGYLFERMP